jgi:ubiquinone/menaquinone biosynthesis C-methylase UbiE
MGFGGRSPAAPDAILLLLLGACQPKPGTAPPPATAAEASVKPGANAEFLRTDLDVDQWAERFEKQGREVYDRRQDIVAATGVKKGQAVADIGAGTGLFTMLFAEAVGREGKVFAVDIAPRFIAHIEKRAHETGVRNVQAVLTGERSVDLPPGSVDLAFLCDTYHHFEHPRSSLASIVRALRPGGELVVVDFKRVPGKSDGWVMGHVRAGQEEVTAEIQAAGFEKIADVSLLKDNYLLRFRRR